MVLSSIYCSKQERCQVTEKLNIDLYRSNSINVAPVTSMIFAQCYKGKSWFVAGGTLKITQKEKFYLHIIRLRGKKR